jgi:hypothetical protein
MPIQTAADSISNSAGSPYGFKNRIINGAMAIDQRNAGASTTVGSGSVYTLDRWCTLNVASSKFSVQQNAGSITPPVGFTNYLGLTSLAATSIATGDYYQVLQTIEGNNIVDLDWGKSTAKPITISFWVRSSLTGSFGGALLNDGNARSYPFSYTINSSNTWEYKTLTIAGDTSGTWLTTNGIGLQLRFGLGIGSTYTTTGGAWVNGVYGAPTGSVNVASTNGATFYITGVQVEKSSQATAFDWRPYGTEYALCLRYYVRINSYGSNGPFASGNAESTTRGYINLTLPQPMRTNPTCSISNISHLNLRGQGTDVVCTSGSFNGQSIGPSLANIIGGEFNTSSIHNSPIGGCVKMSFANASGYIAADAEL